VSGVTRILEAAQQGDPTAADQLLSLVYEELRRLGEGVGQWYCRIWRVTNRLPEQWNLG